MECDAAQLARDDHGVGRRLDREARLPGGAAQRAEVLVVRAGIRGAGVGADAGGGVGAARRGGRRGTVEGLAEAERKEGGGGEGRDPLALRGERRQADAALAVPATALRTRRFRARPSGGSLASSVPSR